MSNPNALANSIPQPTRTKDSRQKTANETKVNCLAHNLDGDLATKVLFGMLDNYVERGVTYQNKVLRLVDRKNSGWCYVVNLYNDPHVKDRVLIHKIVHEDDVKAKERERKGENANADTPGEIDPATSANDLHTESYTK